MAKKFYAVAVGKTPGIYREWKQTELQVKGFPGARYKGFKTEVEAKEWLRQGGILGSSNKQAKKTQGLPSKHGEEVPAGSIVVYTDGGAINNPGPGGYGAIIRDGKSERELQGGYRLTTNNRMELMAAIVALGEIGCDSKPIFLYSDSSYLVNGVKKGWAKGWRRNGWKKSDGKEALNSDLWARLLDSIEGRSVDFRWVKGHAGNPLNERCDRLAVKSAKGSHLPIDHGYE